MQCVWGLFQSPYAYVDCISLGSSKMSANLIADGHIVVGAIAEGWHNEEPFCVCFEDILVYM